MVKITQEVLKRYHQGVCTTEEKKAVEKWLEVDAELAVNPFTEEKTEELKEEVWEAIETKLETKASSIKIVPSKIWQYGTAACVAFLLFFLVFQKNTNQKFSPTAKNPVATNDTDTTKEATTDFIVINSSIHDKQKFSDTDCAISFQGRINIYNGFSKEVAVLCNGVILRLQPNQYYTMFSKEDGEIQGFSKGRRNSGPIGNHSSQFKVCT